MTRGDDWSFFPWFLLRGTGFGVERLLAVAAAGAAGASDAERVQRERRALFAALGDPLGREALQSSSPLVDQNFDGWRAQAESGRRNSQDKKRERALWRFLQRFTAKNDSTSFFGAVAAGRFDSAASFAQDAPAPIDCAAHPLPIETARATFATQWVAEALLERAVAELWDAGLHAPAPRRAPGTDSAGALWLPGGASFRRGPDEDAAVDRNHLPSGLVDPIAAARASLQEEPASPLRDAWLARFDAYAALRERLHAARGALSERRALAAEADELLAGWLGAPARRNEGEFYASRGPFHEQADRTGGAVTIPAAWTALLSAALGSYLDLGLLLAAPDRLKLRAWVAAQLGDATAYWREALGALASDPLALERQVSPEAKALAALASELRTELRTAIDAHLAAHGADVPFAFAVDGSNGWAQRIHAALAAAPPLGVAFANPDLMLALGPDQTPIPILAEAHHLPHPTGCLLPPLALGPAITAEVTSFLAALCAPARPAFPVSYDHSFISVAPDFGAVGLELSGLAKEPPERRGTFAELAVTLRDGLLRFLVPDHADGTPLEVAPITRTARLHLASPVFSVNLPELGEWLAGPDWRPIEALPRLSWGRLVVHRRTFAIPDEAAWDQAPLPRFVFARLASEPKPVLIDRASALGDQLARWWLGRGEALTVSEMLPAPDQLWLRSADGHHTVELRTVLVRGMPTAG